MTKPITGRNISFLKVIDILNQTYNTPITIVEKSGSEKIYRDAYQKYITEI